MPGQTVQSLCAVSGFSEYERHSRGLARHYVVSEAQFTEFSASVVAYELR
jgi:hypothetical protein